MNSNFEKLTVFCNRSATRNFERGINFAPLSKVCNDVKSVTLYELNIQRKWYCSQSRVYYTFYKLQYYEQYGSFDNPAGIKSFDGGS